MDFTFNGEIAKTYGIDGAVFIQNLYLWILKNKANGRHFYEGKNWTYNSISAFTELFPFWSKKQIERLIKKLENDGAIKVGNFNENPLDRTRWFTLSEEIIRTYKTVYPISRNREMQNPKSGNDNILLYNLNNRVSSNNLNSNKENNLKKEIYKEKKKVDNTFLLALSNTMSEYDFSEPIQNILIEWVRYKKEDKKFTYKEFGLRQLLKKVKEQIGEIGEHSVIESFENCMANGYSGVFFKGAPHHNVKIEARMNPDGSLSI